MSMLPDDTYDVFIIDATDTPEHNVVRLELTITSGAHKGEVIAIRAANLPRDAIQLIGDPATLRVQDGVPTVNFN